MEFKPKRTLILFMAIFIVVIVILIIYLIKFNPLRISKLRKLSYLYELDDHYQFKKRAKSPENVKIIVSMTTIPERLPHLYPALSSILDQSRSVDAIHLNLPKISRKGKAYLIPEWMKSLKNVKIVWLEKDFGPSTKLIPSLLVEDKTTRIIVLDDDNLYHYRTIERLTEEFEDKNKEFSLLPKYAISTFGVSLDGNGKIPPFVSLSRVQTMFQKSKRVDHLQGCFGFIVTPSMFPYEVFGQDLAPEYVKSVDDVWFSSWLALNGIEIWTLDYSFWILPIHDRGKVNVTPSLFNGENKGFIPEEKTLKWFRETYGYRCLACQN